MSLTSTRDWLALHIFYHNVMKQDAFLNECLIPAIRTLQAEGHCQDWFFLRYWEGGTHVRVRFLNPSAAVEEKIREAATAFMAAHPPEQELTREAYYENHTFDGEPVDVETLPWYPNGSVVQLPYEPEYKRYGGRHAMALGEEVFRISSDTAAAVIAATPGEYQKRMSMAMDLMILMARCLGVEADMMAPYFNRYSLYWQRFTPQPEDVRAKIKESFERQSEQLVPRFKTLLQFVNSADDFPIYREFVNQLLDVRRRLEELAEQGLLESPYDEEPVDSAMRTVYAITGIAFSHLHMTNNRLGLTPVYEHYLGYMVHLTAAKATGE